jgi:DNA-binding NarL/FixJ family response regulator/drug/metabolite transporter (DMT)-like permease
MNYEVLIVDDHPLYRLALKGAVAAACENCEIFEADSVGGLFDALDRHPHVDLLLLDLNLPGAYGFNALAHLRGFAPRAAHHRGLGVRRSAHRAPGIGIRGAELRVQIRRRGHHRRSSGGLARRGGIDERGRDSKRVRRVGRWRRGRFGALEIAQRMAQLTPQQFRVLGMLCAGRLNKQIGDDLQITEATVKAHMTVILRKLGAANRTQAVLCSPAAWRASVYAVGFSFAYVGLTTGTGALLLFGAVQLIMISAGLIAGEQLRPQSAIGWMIAAAGVLILLFPGITAPPLREAGSMLCAGIAWGVYSLRGRRSRDPLRDTSGNFVRAVPVALLISALWWAHRSWDTTGAWYAALSGSLASGLGYAAWYTALPRMTAVAAGNAQLSVPVIAALGGVVLFGEPITARLAVASALVLGGIAIALRPQRVACDAVR